MQAEEGSVWQHSATEWPWERIVSPLFAWEPCSMWRQETKHSRPPLNPFMHLFLFTLVLNVTLPRELVRLPAVPSLLHETGGH
jgi:hypothetical protein